MNFVPEENLPPKFGQIAQKHVLHQFWGVAVLTSLLLPPGGETSKNFKKSSLSFDILELKSWFWCQNAWNM